MGGADDPADAVVGELQARAVAVVALLDAIRPNVSVGGQAGVIVPGVQRGDRVVSCMPNIPETLITFAVPKLVLPSAQMKQ